MNHAISRHTGHELINITIRLLNAVTIAHLPGEAEPEPKPEPRGKKVVSRLILENAGPLLRAYYNSAMTTRIVAQQSVVGSARDFLGIFLFCLLSYTTVLGAQEHFEYEFYFTRGMYSDDFGVGDEFGGSWSIDYPKADRHFLRALERFSVIDASPDKIAVKLTDPQLRHLPFIYALEVGAMQLDEAEVEALRDYLLAGGFLFIDDFWGSWAMGSLVEQMQLVFPDREISEIATSHPLFHVAYDIEEIKQVPNLQNGISFQRLGVTHEDDGKSAHVRGIFDDKGRLMVLINWNTDLGDAWEWADHPAYPVHFSTFAFQLGINAVIYAMTH